jgi:23S rRNA (cytosine1962-C5)-methyltransferase
LKEIDPIIDRIISNNQQRLQVDKDIKRVFQGRGDINLDHNYLNIDFYPPVVLITLFKEEKIDLLQLATSLRNELFSKDSINSNDYAVLIQRRYLKNTPSELILGQLPDKCFAIENNLRFQLNFTKNQNIGFFPDMKNGRDFIYNIAKDKKVLNLFAYTCSFSVAAVAGKARSVVNIDMSKHSLKTGKINHELNGHTLDRSGISFLPYNILKSWGRIKKMGPYDIIIIDPPTNQGKSFWVERDYRKIANKLEGLISHDGIVLACLNSPHHKLNFLIDIFKEEASFLEIQKTLYSPDEFYGPQHDKEKGLKMIVLRKKN